MISRRSVGVWKTLHSLRDYGHGLEENGAIEAKPRTNNPVSSLRVQPALVQALKGVLVGDAAADGLEDMAAVQEPEE